MHLHPIMEVACEPKVSVIELFGTFVGTIGKGKGFSSLGSMAVMTMKSHRS